MSTLAELRIGAVAKVARIEGADDPTGRTVVFGLGLAWHHVFAPGIVQKGDEPPQ